jgi:hypothetical protein
LYPIIKDKSGKQLAILNNVSQATIREKINGDYTFTFIAIIEELKTDYIQYGNQIEIKNQLFNIVTYTKERTSNNKLLCSVYCEQVSYELLEENTLFDYSNITATEALQYALEGTPFTVGTVEDLGTQTFQRDEQEINKRALLIDIAQAYDAELEFDKYTVNLYSMRGANNGVEIRLGKNLKGIKHIVDGTKKDSEGNPKVIYEIDFLELEELDEFKALETIRLGDTVKPVDEGLGIEIAARIVEYEYNPIEKRNSKVILSNFQDDISTYNVEIRKTVNEVKNYKDIWNRAKAINSNNTISTSILEGTIDAANNDLKAGLGTVKVTDNNGILILDNQDEQLATKALRLLGGTLAISNEKDQSGNWIWRTFGTGDGFVADEIVSGTIWTNLISIVGNADNPNAFKWDSEGLKVYKLNTDNTIDTNQYILIDNEGIRFTKDAGKNYFLRITFTDAGFVVDHGNGSQTIMDEEGFKKKILSNGNEYVYLNLFESGTASLSGSSSGVDNVPDEATLDSQGIGIAWITLTNPDFIGREFIVTPSFRGAPQMRYLTGDGNTTTMTINVEVLEYDYVNARFKVRARVKTVTPANFQNWWYVDACDISYIAFAKE